MEVLEDCKGNKDHLTVTKGEKLSVILIAHPNLPRGELLVDNEEGFGNILLLHVHVCACVYVCVCIVEPLSIKTLIISPNEWFL